MTTRDNRRNDRKTYLVEIQYMSDSPVIKARVSDISIGGIFIDTLNPLPEGSLLRFKLPLPGRPEESPIEGEGRVAWRQETLGMGLEFKKLRKGDWHRLKDFMETWETKEKFRE